MAIIGSVKIGEWVVDYWKYTYRVILPTGRIFWGTSREELTAEKCQFIVANLKVVFQAGIDKQCEIIKEALHIK